MWIVCAFYSKNTLYEEHSKKLIESLKKFNLPHDVIGIEDRGDWFANMQYKPIFLKTMLKKHHPSSVIYVDVDAIFYRYPSYFNKLHQESKVNIAVYVLDHSKFARKHCTPEMLSGTIFLKNTKEANQIIDEWIEECKTDPKLWDQRALATVLSKHNYHLLPAEYCTIFDYMSSIKEPVIKHYQASRESRRVEAVKRKRDRVRKNKPTPRKVVSNGRVIRIRRSDI